MRNANLIKERGRSNELRATTPWNPRTSPLRQAVTKNNNTPNSPFYFIFFCRGNKIITTTKKSLLSVFKFKTIDGETRDRDAKRERERERKRRKKKDREKREVLLKRERERDRKSNSQNGSPRPLLLLLRIPPFLAMPHFNFFPVDLSSLSFLRFFYKIFKQRNPTRSSAGVYSLCSPPSSGLNLSFGSNQLS